MPPSTSESGLTRLDVSTFKPIAIDLALCIIAWKAWVHRRVESSTFVDDRSLRRRVSVDATVSHLPAAPWDKDARVVPLTLLRKAPLNQLDVEDETGRPLPVLTTFENGSMAAAILIETAAAFTNGSAGIDDELERIARSPRDVAALELSQLKPRWTNASADDVLKQLNTDAFAPLCESFAENFILAVLISAEGHSRRVLKFSYAEEQLESSPVRRRERLSRSFGWQARPYEFSIPSAGQAQSYHFEVGVPEGVLIQEALVVGDDDEGADGADLVYEEITAPGVNRVHLHVPDDRGVPTVAVAVRIARTGWLRTALMATVAVCALMLLSAWRLPALLDRSADEPVPMPVVVVEASGEIPVITERASRSDGAQRTAAPDVAALLMAVVGVLVAVVQRPGEHPLTARFVSAVRLVSVGAALLPMSAAWLLAFGPSGEALERWWWGLAAISVLPALVTWRAYRTPLVTPSAYDPQ